MLHISGLAEHLSLAPDTVGLFIACESSEDLVFISATLLIMEESGMYVNTLLFDFFRKNREIEFFDAFVTIPYRPFVPLIYHDIGKVVIVSDERIDLPNYRSKHFAMLHQFERAEIPLRDTVSVILNPSDEIWAELLEGGIRDVHDLSFANGEPFTVREKYMDYVMLPVAEIFRQLDMEFALSDNGIVELYVGGHVYRFEHNVPLFSYDEVDWQNNFIHEAVPEVVNEILFVSHMDLQRLLPYVHMHLDRNHSILFISIMEW